MTFAIRPGSPRAPHAERFAVELRRAMEARQVGRIRLAMAMGLGSHSIIAAWRSGESLPKAATARSLAAVLEWPRLLELVLEARTQQCARPSCPVTFVHEGSGPKLYCSVRCRRIMEQADGVASGRRERDTLYREREQLRAAVRAFCEGCEPAGLCRRSGCSLRPVSPLPLLPAASHVREVATPYDREAGLQALRDGAARALDQRWHGEGGEENRRRQGEQTRERWASMSPEERAEVGRRIAENRSAASG